jgi:hypothetical protein
MIDILVLDEADRMIEDGHFKEMKMILDFVYNKRVEYKKQSLAKNRLPASTDVPVPLTAEQEEKRAYKERVIQRTKGTSSKEHLLLKDVEKSASKVDLSNIVDLYDEDGIMEEISPENLVIDEEDKKKEKGKKVNKKLEEKKRKEEEERLTKDYKKMGGIQHIICSATMTIDNTGRITPKQVKKLKKQGMYAQKQTVDTLELLCKTLKFRSKSPKVIDLTGALEGVEGGNNQRMPDTLTERAIRCKKEEKDLYSYYFLRENRDQPTIIFCNSITCVRRLTSLLSFLKVPNQWPLHSKMQQRQRLKNLDRFKTAVSKCETGTSGGEGAILVCTDVAARGLDIPYV